MLWAVFAVILIYLGSTRLEPRIPPGQIWVRWRERRILWGASLILTFSAALLTADAIWRKVAYPDLFWQSRVGEITMIAMTGAAAAYLLVLLFFVLIPLLHRNRRRRTSGPAGR